MECERLCSPRLAGFSADGKVLRGSRRDDPVGVHLVALVQHEPALVIQQRRVTDGNGELGALWQLLQRTDLTIAY